MSLGYASRLSHRAELGGQLGAPEYKEHFGDFEKKINHLTQLFLSSQKIVVFTGAGISTSCGIPDFRGPSGIWTLQRQGKKLPKLKTSFVFAKPSLTHQALKCLVDCQKVAYIVSQNVDGLHLRSGIPRDKIAELHGNTFCERCRSCRKEYVRDFEMSTVGFRLTGRYCEVCPRKLRDHVLDWDNALPEDELQLSEEHSSSADLVVCLGTSLQITPACDIPLETLKSGGKIVIVNLQKTPKDGKACLVIHEKVDKVMSRLMKNLNLKIPDYIREDRILVLHRQGIPTKMKEQSSIVLEVVSPHGFRSPLPIIKSIKLQINTGQSTSIHLTQYPFFYKQKQGLKHKKLVDEVDFRTAEVNYEFEVLDRNAYFDYLQQTTSLPSSLSKLQSTNRLPIIQYKEHNFQTQFQRYE